MNSDIENIKRYVRAADYLVVSQLFLQNNFLLENPLSFDDIKPRLLGHWGTCPGINFVYAHLNYLIKKHDLDMLFVLGPGHGFPALQANLFLEGTLQKYYKEATHTPEGIAYISKNFSWPYGFPSHSNPGAPGVIVEGGELGYSLATSYGAVLDNPNLIVSCLVGDGEAETGPTATAWHLNKFIDPETNGAVLPILHLNGYKISGPAIFGRMKNSELKSLFIGYGYDVLIVDETNNIYETMAEKLETAYQKIISLQNEARSGKKVVSPKFPMIILRTPKGWTGIKRLHGNKLEGNCLSHQIPAPNAKSDKVELKNVEKWMKSYVFEELFDKEKGFDSQTLSILPTEHRRMGNNRHAFGDYYKPLELPDLEKFSEDTSVPGTIGSSSMRRAGLFLNDVFSLNDSHKSFRLFSPDETYSNKLDNVFDVTSRAFVWPHKRWDKDLSQSGRVIEMLSEHSLQGLMQGYVLTGRHAVFASYEAFIQIVSSMTDQYVKFLRVARETSWRNDIASLNYILTSSGWRQEHNGFSHQNPGFISNILEKHGDFINVYFPPDGNSTLAVLEKSLLSKNSINIIVAGKTLEPRWLTIEKAREELKNGLMIWDFASDDDPDIVIAGVSDYMTKECLAAIDILKTEVPEINVRFVNIMELSALGIGSSRCRLSEKDFIFYFTADKPVIFNFHGYPEVIESMLLRQKNPERFSVRGYIENGSTTTPFDMQIRNKTSRYHLIMEAVRHMAERGVITSEKAEGVEIKYRRKLSEHGDFIRTHGVDPEEIETWQWKRDIS